MLLNQLSRRDALRAAVHHRRRRRQLRPHPGVRGLRNGDRHAAGDRRARERRLRVLDAGQRGGRRLDRLLLRREEVAAELILFIRDADGSFETSDDRRLAIFDPADPGVVELPTDLPANPVEFSAAVAPDGALRLAFTAIDMPEVGLVACGFRHFPRHHLRVGMLAYEAWQNGLTSHEAILRDLFVESPFVHPSVMFRRDAVLAVGGYRDLGWAEDYDLWLRLAGAGVRFARLPEELFFWRDRPERATRTMTEYSFEAFRACKLHHLCKGFLEGEREVVLAGAGQEGRAWCRALAGAGVRVSAWVDVDPRKVGRTLHGALVLPATAMVPDGRKLLITVGTRGARAGVRAWAQQAGFAEGRDFVCVT